MRISVFCGISVDGFIARRDHTLDFLPSDGGEPHGFEEFFASVDALVIGRNTYDVVLGFGGWGYGKKPVYVLSSRSISQPPKNAVVERLEGDPADIVQDLIDRGHSHIYLDGGITIQRFLNCGLVDRLIVTRVPVLIGDGIPLFGPLDNDIVLDHVETRSYKSGLVQSVYDVKK
jgi:dihydrofolate reductase